MLIHPFVILLFSLCALQANAIEVMDEGNLSGVSAQYYGGTPEEIDRNVQRHSGEANLQSKEPDQEIPMPSVQLLNQVQINGMELHKSVENNPDMLFPYYSLDQIPNYSPWVPAK
ncbi:MAG: hypothetical protein IPM37_07965 [Hahellaceae bacterium]|nr:hypothetical protein [Hahellaceae bacterium]